MKKLSKILLIILIAIFTVLFLRKISDNYNADVHAKNSKTAISNDDLSKAFSEIDIAITLNPNEPSYYRQRARTLLSLAQTKDPKVNEIAKRSALVDLEKAIDLNPRNLVTARNVVPLYYLLASNGRTVDNTFINNAAGFYSKMLENTAHDVGVYVLLAKYHKLLDLNTGYNYCIEKITELRPDILTWHENFIQKP